MARILEIDRRELERDRDKVLRNVYSAGTGSIRKTTKDVERQLEAQTRVHVGGQLWKAWTSAAYPKKGIAREPVGVIGVNGGSRSRGAIQYFTNSGRVSATDGGPVAIPLPAAGVQRRDRRNLTPEEWERRHPGAKLRLVKRPGRPALLVVDEAVLSGKKQLARLNTARRRATGTRNTTVPIFVLMFDMPHANSVAIDPILRRADRQIERNLLAGLKE